MHKMEKTVPLNGSSGTPDLNDALVIASISTGVGYSAVDHFNAFLNVLFVSTTTHLNLAIRIEGVSWRVLAEVGRSGRSSN